MLRSVIRDMVEQRAKDGLPAPRLYVIGASTQRDLISRGIFPADGTDEWGTFLGVRVVGLSFDVAEDLKRAERIFQL